MHDPLSVAHEIYLGAKQKKNGRWRSPIITIWHKDPDIHGDDDSCGWFIRKRHVGKVIIEKVTKEFEFNFKHNYWFNEGGYPKFSVTGTVLEMYSKASWVIFMHLNNDNPDRRRHTRFMTKYLYDIMHFAENPFDSIGDAVYMKYGVEKPEARIENFVSIITADIMRKIRPWWQHPRWHIHHWRIVFHPIQNLKRRYWDKCCICGKRGFKSSACSDWYGTKIWHQECDGSSQKSPVPQTNQP